MIRTLRNALIALLLLAFGTWAFFAPHLTVRSMRLAAEAGDADALSRHVDYPALRASVKEQLSKELGASISGIAGNSDLGRFGAKIAGVLGDTALNPAVDAMVRPETLSAIFAGQDLANEYALLPSGGGNGSDAGAAPYGESADTPTFETSTIETANLRATMGYDSLNRFAIDAQEPQSGRRIKLLLNRHRLLWWKLSAVELPPR